MKFELLGKEGAPSLMLIPGLGVSYEIFLPLVELLKDKFRITAVQVDGFTLVSGISKLVFTFRTQAFLPNSGSRALSAVLEIIIGIIFLGNNIFLAFSLPVIFAMWVLIESVIIAVNSFDYKRVGFPGWFVILLLGICGIVLGVLGLKNPDVTATTLSTLIGLGVIAMGISNLFALRGINRFEKAVDGVFKNNADEQ